MRIAVLVGSFTAALALAACFETPTADISFRCGPADECPDGYECRADGCCHLLGSSESVTCDLADAAVVLTDASNLDAGIDATPADAGTDATPVDATPPDAMTMSGSLVSLTPTAMLFPADESVDVTVVVDAPAPMAGTVIDLSSSDTGVATVPATVTVADGMTSATFTVTGVGAGDVTISATLGIGQLDSNLTVAGVTAQAGDVIINEFLALSSSGGNSGEFIELVNIGLVTLDISGWTVSADALTDTVMASSLMASDPVYLAPGDVVYGVPNPADPMDIPMDADFVYGTAGAALEFNDAGSIVDLTAGATVIDAIDFTGWQTGAGATPTAGQFPGLLDRATQLDFAFQSGMDNDSGASWCVPASATPGAFNEPCTAQSITEFLADAFGADTDNEFVEVWGVPGTEMGGWRIRSTDANGNLTGADVTLAAGTRMPLDGYLVVADNGGGSTNVANADVETALGLPDDNAGLQLISAANTAVDAIGYGTLAVMVDTADGFPIVETAPATIAEGSSLTRDANDTDTNTNNTDFHLDPTPTPGAPSDVVNLSLAAANPPDSLATSTSSVALTGTDLIAGATFTVGGNAATCTVTSATSASCTFPDNGGTAATGIDIMVQNPDGNTDTLTGGFAYTGVLADPGVAFWCVLQFPTATTTTAGAATESIFGQIYASGMTDASATPVAGIVGQVGYGADGADPTAVNFSWTTTTPNPGHDFGGGNDEHQGTLTVNAAGSYDYAYRFSLDSGLNFYYCDSGTGSDDGFSSANAGDLTVN